MSSQDRQVAEWVLFLGGELVLRGVRGRVQDLSQLPRHDFEVEVVDLVGTFAETKDLQRLAGLERN